MPCWVLQPAPQLALPPPFTPLRAAGEPDLYPSTDQASPAFCRCGLQSV